LKCHSIILKTRSLRYLDLSGIALDKKSAVYLSHAMQTGPESTKGAAASHKLIRATSDGFLEDGEEPTETEAPQAPNVDEVQIGGAENTKSTSVLNSLRLDNCGLKPPVLESLGKCSCG
jgi:hypothetical protein